MSYPAWVFQFRTILRKRWEKFHCWYFNCNCALEKIFPRNCFVFRRIKSLGSHHRGKKYNFNLENLIIFSLQSLLKFIFHRQRELLKGVFSPKNYSSIIFSWWLSKSRNCSYMPKDFQLQKTPNDCSTGTKLISRKPRGNKFLSNLFPYRSILLFYLIVVGNHS